MLAIPVLPGTGDEPGRLRPVPPPPPTSRRWPVVLGVVAVVVAAAIVVPVLLLGGGSSSPKTSEGATRTAPKVQTPPPAPTPVHTRPKPKPTPAQRAHTLALRLARRLPVALESAALLQQGSSVYVVGGNVHGKPVDSIWQIDLAHNQVHEVGHFIEPLAGAASATHGGALYLAGGWTGEKLATAVLRWTPGSAPTLVTRLPVGVRGARGAFVGSTLYVAGGSSGSKYAVDVDAGSVSAVTSTPKAVAAPSSNIDVLARALLRRAG
jgi:hypothetical protein